MTQRNDNESLSVEQIAPCLGSGPLAASGRRLVEAADALGEGPTATALRALCVPAIFHATEHIFRGEADPTPQLAEAFESLASALAASTLVTLARSLHERVPEAPASSIETKTGEHYGKLFREFDAKSYWDEPRELLKTRLERNGIAITNFTGKRVLDAGCGGGRYTVAWHLLGAAEATGLDISESGLEDARRRVAQAGIEGVSFKQGSVLDIPADDGAYDVVFSNGVLHHTTDWKKGVNELVRTLAPGGFGWLYLIENPGGLFWDSIEVLRAVMRNEQPAFARQALATFGVPANRRFYMLDHVMVPINLRLTSQQIVQQLESAGARNIRRLERGADFDRVEAIAQKRPHALAKFGVGEHRFVFSK